MKTILAVTFFFMLTVGFLSCTDEDKIAAAIQEGKELNEGDPLRLVLYQNYPNPFNPSTTIQFSVAYRMRVTLRVLTEDWEEVATLLDRVLNPGHYQVSFDAANLPSGEYYYTLDGDGLTLVRRMRLVK